MVVEMPDVKEDDSAMVGAMEAVATLEEEKEAAGGG